MCGIAGVVSSRPVEELQQAMGRMVEALRHRGPDGLSTSVVGLPGQKGHLVLGHARLSVLDLSDCASQPMLDPVTGNWLVYNGELYNYRDVRKKLEDLGHSFTSSGDTEVLLKALGEWGEAALAEFEGMYALGFWDARAGELMLARDPVGIKPLLYALAPGLFMFGSELKALRASRLLSLSVDHDAIDSFLYYGAVIEPRTMFREVKMLAKGSVMRVRGTVAGAVHTTSRLAELYSSRNSSDTFVQAVEKVDALISASVESQLVSDVPLGIALSGGIDSTLITHHASRSGVAGNIRLLTVATEEAGFSEKEAAQSVANKLGLRHDVAMLSASELLGRLPAAVAAMDQPTVDGVNVFIVSKIAAEQGTRVLLSGLGGDEVFGGYTTFTKVPLLHRYAGPLGLLARQLIKDSRGRSPEIHKVAQAWPRVNYVNAYLLQRAIRWRESVGFLSALPPGPPDAAAVPPESSDALQSIEGNGYRRVAEMEIDFYMKNQLLRDADIFSSAHGVEIRVPFLDTRLMQYALNLPAAYHVKMNNRKRLLRHIVRKDQGRGASRRRKMGFTLPWDIWLRRELFREVSETLLERSAYDGIGIDARQVERMLAAFKSGEALVPWQQVWSLYALVKTVNRPIQ